MLDEQQIFYTIVGSVASMSYVDPRMTRYLDVMIQVDIESVEPLCAAFPEPDWYVSVDVARDAVERRKQFNTVHLPMGNKIDFMIARDTEWGRQQLQRRQPINVDGYPAYVAHLENIILGKPQDFHEGGSDKHLTDIANMLETSGHLIDCDNVSLWSDRLNVREEWNLVLHRIESSDSSFGKVGST